MARVVLQNILLLGLVGALIVGQCMGTHWRKRSHDASGEDRSDRSDSDEDETSPLGVFEEDDKNKDGKLDMSELAALMRKDSSGSEEVSDQDVQGYFLDLDRNHDGVVDGKDFNYNQRKREDSDENESRRSMHSSSSEGN